MASATADSLANNIIQVAKATDFQDADSFQALTGRIENLVRQHDNCSDAIDIALQQASEEPWHDQLKVAVAGASAMLNVHSEATGDVLITLLGLPVVITPSHPVVQLSEAQKEHITENSYGHWLGQPDTGLLFMTDCVVPLSVLNDRPHRLLHNFLGHIGSIASADASDIANAHEAPSQLRKETLAYKNQPPTDEPYVGIYLMWELWGEGQMPPITRFQVMPREDQVKWVTMFRDTIAEQTPAGSQIQLSGIFPILDAIERARTMNKG